MYRIITLILLSIMASIEGCRPPPCHWSDPTQIENYFDVMVTELVAADTKAQQFCHQHGSYMITERHDLTEYKLALEAPGFDINDIDVKIRNRVLSVSASNAYNCESSFFDLRILPEYLETHGAMWKYIGGKLIVTFRYKFDPVNGECRPCYNRTTFIENIRRDPRRGDEHYGAGAGAGAGVANSKVALTPPPSL